MARRPTGRRDEIEMSLLLNNDDEAGCSRGSNDQLRFMVLGGDDDLMDKACGTILGERENRDAFKFGIVKPKTAHVCGRQVSVLKTPSYWLEHLESYYILSNGVKSLKNDLQYFELLLFPGPHAFLLVHRDVKNSGREYYLLKALSDVFGKEVLDYCMVLFIDEARHDDPIKNTCLKMCGGRYHILQNTEESLNLLFKKQEAMTQWKSSNFFTNNWEIFRIAENYFEAEYKKKENKLRIELAENKQIVEILKKEIDDMKDARIKDEQNKLAESKDREKQLQSELDALKSSKNQEGKLKQELSIYTQKNKELRSELAALESSKNQKEENLQKLKQELSIYTQKNSELSSELAALKSSENQMKEKLKQEMIIHEDKEKQLRSELAALKNSENQMKEKLKQELTIYKDKERHLKDDKIKLQRDKEKLQREVEQLKDNKKQ